jgi:glycerol-1-phosphate dehydrogenase [NAD(P)+]
VAVYPQGVNPWMTKLQDALRAEGILSSPERSALVPAQYYGEGINEFAAQFQNFIEASLPGVKSINLFVDGVPKGCSEKEGSHVDAVFCEALTAAGFAVDMIVLSHRFGTTPHDFHASYDNVEKTREIVRSRAPGAYMVLGSGSITDVVKHALFLEGVSAPFISVPTALTVTAFTSAFSIIDVHGAKRTQPSRVIDATFWVQSILECAPVRMSRAGYGDLLARFLAYGDWYLGWQLGVMDRYDECAFRLMEPFAQGIKESAHGFSQDPMPDETIKCVAASLAMAGIAMSVSGETTPLSGFEHVISHGLDFLRLISGRELVFHGEQVALGCLTSGKAIDRLLGQERINPEGWLEDPEGVGLKTLNDLIDTAPVAAPHDRIESAREEFVGEYEKKSQRWVHELARGKKNAFIGNWTEIRKNLERVTLRAVEIERLAAISGLPRRPQETMPPTSMEEYDWAIRFSPFVRSRTNVSDLIFWMGGDVRRACTSIDYFLTVQNGL